jgi:hypothetical protein
MSFLIHVFHVLSLKMKKTHIHFRIFGIALCQTDKVTWHLRGIYCILPRQSNWNEVFRGLQWIITDSHASQLITNCNCLEWFKHCDLRCCWHCVNTVISNVCCHGVSIVILNVADIGTLMVTLWDTDQDQYCCWQKRGDQLQFVLMVVFQATYTVWVCYFPI